jgi:hypothetical protein
MIVSGFRSASAGEIAARNDLRRTIDIRGDAADVGGNAARGDSTSFPSFVTVITDHGKLDKPRSRERRTQGLRERALVVRF